MDRSILFEVHLTIWLMSLYQLSSSRWREETWQIWLCNTICRWFRRRISLGSGHMAAQMADFSPSGIRLLGHAMHIHDTLKLPSVTNIHSLMPVGVLFREEALTELACPFCILQVMKSFLYCPMDCTPVIRWHTCCCRLLYSSAQLSLNKK
jgi:hypothetical protein